MRLRFFSKPLALKYAYGASPKTVQMLSERYHRKSSRLDFLWYLSDNIWTVLGLAPYAYFRARSDEKNRRRMFWGMTRYYTYFGAVFVYDWRIGAMFVLVPLLCMNF